MSVVALFEPLGLEAFKARIFGRDWFCSTDRPDRLNAFLTFEEVQQAITRARVIGDRVKMVRGRRNISPREFALKPHATDGSLLDESRTRSLIQGGATLVVNAIEELSPAIRDVVEALEHTFDLAVSANAYISAGSTGGFGAHWDDHDTLILQVTGPKVWEIWHPAPGRTPPDPEAREQLGPPAQTVTLSPGDVLYLPYGWWHSVTAAKALTIHITLGLQRPTWEGYVRWLSKRWHQRPALRGLLPLHRTNGNGAANGHGDGDAHGNGHGDGHGNSNGNDDGPRLSFRDLLADGDASPDMHEYIEWAASAAHVRPRNPLSVLVAPPTRWDDGVEVRLLVGRRIGVHAVNDGPPRVYCGGAERPSLAQWVEPLQRLRHDRHCDWRTLIDGVPATRLSAFRQVLTGLEMAGLIERRLADT
jgi:hypothetical protein